ncbi:hypothetical protein ERO13_A13G166200v2 [Gossypium hirsutum]|uniref:Acyl carrier protein n=1 Tax=Gossypium hirsutum TaxID=3635 RepID=A0A1U8IGL0_GOSHI|nr:acyl carrier protein 2, chloroplastic [Gossypium hirsutum]KAG4166949.1 hypothetical protein ERO13_A13G166200v2 [Gossypium hirsutum]
MASIAASSISMQPRHALATTRASGLKLASFVNQERNNLSFRLRPVPARLRISCAAKPETVDKVCEIARKQLALSSDEPVTGASKFSDLGADSLDTVEIVMGIEEEFGVTIKEDNAITTVQDAADLIEKLCRAKGA